MNWTFYLLATLVLLGAVGAMAMRNLIHCALCMAAAFVALAGLYLQLGAPFLALAQVLVYVGAVAVLILFAVLLTRGLEANPRLGAPGWRVGLAAAFALFGAVAGSLGFLVSKGFHTHRSAPTAFVDPTVLAIGNKLMSEYVLPLQVAGLLLTVAAVGGVILALRDGDAERLSDNAGGHNA